MTDLPNIPDNDRCDKMTREELLVELKKWQHAHLLLAVDETGNWLDCGQVLLHERTRADKAEARVAALETQLRMVCSALDHRHLLAQTMVLLNKRWKD